MVYESKFRPLPKPSIYAGSRWSEIFMSGPFGLNSSDPENSAVFRQMPSDICRSPMPAKAFQALYPSGFSAALAKFYHRMLIFLHVQLFHLFFGICCLLILTGNIKHYVFPAITPVPRKMVSYCDRSGTSPAYAGLAFSFCSFFATSVSSS